MNAGAGSRFYSATVLLLWCQIAGAAWPMLDKHFHIGAGANGGISEILVQRGKKIWIAGGFDEISGRTRTNIARLHASGHADSFRSDYTSYVPDYLFPTIYTMAVQPDKRVLIGGDFGLYRLKVHGGLDPSFSSDVPIVNTILVQKNGSVLAGLYAMTSRFNNRPLVRLHHDGSVDESFQCEMTPNTQVFCIVPRPGNKFLVAGNFQAVNGVSRARLAVIQDDGSLDATFNASSIGGAYPNSWDIAPYDIKVQPDQKILIAGLFQYVGGEYRGYIARLNADGTLDATFNKGAQGGLGFDYVVNSLAIQHDGKIICGGEFTSYNGVARRSLVRLNTDGTLDTAFNAGSGLNGPLNKVVLWDKNHLLIGGSYTAFDENPQGNFSMLLLGTR